MINLDDPSLISPSDMQQAVLNLLTKTNQSLPSSNGEMTRLLLESLAMRYRVCLGWLEQLLGYKLERLYIVGGGVQNELLCQMTADATNRTIIAAHSEATAIGNALMQGVGTGRSRRSSKQDNGSKALSNRASIRLRNPQPGTMRLQSSMSCSRSSLSHMYHLI